MHSRNIVTMELLQCDHRERKLKLAYEHGVKAGESSPSRILVTLYVKVPVSLPLN